MARESLTSKQDRSMRIMKTLIVAQPEARCTLNFTTDWQLLFAAILASQCTDERVNLITSDLFTRWPNLTDYLSLNVEEVEGVIKSCGLYKMKAKSIVGSAQMLMNDHNGVLPRSTSELMKFPGVGQKIANLLVGELYGIPQIVVDTHCGRIARLLGLTKAKEPKKVEQDLAKILREEDWIRWGHHMVELGRTSCKARCKQCAACPIFVYCAYADSIFSLIDEDQAAGIWDRCY